MGISKDKRLLILLHCWNVERPPRISVSAWSTITHVVLQCKAKPVKKQLDLFQIRLQRIHCFLHDFRGFETGKQTSSPIPHMGINSYVEDFAHLQPQVSRSNLFQCYTQYFSVYAYNCIIFDGVPRPIQNKELNEAKSQKSKWETLHCMELNETCYTYTEARFSTFVTV